MPRVWAVPDRAFLQGVLTEVESCLRSQGSPPAVCDAVGDAARRPDDAELLHKAGYALVDVELGEVAIGIFAAAFALDPNRIDTPVELALALENVDNYTDAVRVLKYNPNVVLQHPAGAGLLACDAAMAGDLATLRSTFPSVPIGGVLPFLRTKAEGYVARADALSPVVRLDGTALRAWHALLSGGLLLQEFEGGGNEMNGRYAAVWLQHSDVTNVIRALVTLLDQADRRPARVISPPDHSSQILGRATATALGVTFGSDLTDGTFDQPTLVVAFDWSAVIRTYDSPRLRDRRDLIFFAYTLTWTHAVGLPPDVVGILSQACFAPWDQSMRVTNLAAAGDGERPAVDIVPADLREPALIARAIVSAPFDAANTPPDTTPDDSAAVRAFCDALSTAREHVGLFGGVRSQYLGGGPVASNRFES